MAENSLYSTWRGLLARIPAEFEGSNEMRVLDGYSETYPINQTNRGFQLKLKLRPREAVEQPAKEFLHCSNVQEMAQQALVVYGYGGFVTITTSE
jgi:hypothetical protein